jgi:hypothetical protein
MKAQRFTWTRNVVDQHVRRTQNRRVTRRRPFLPFHSLHTRRACRIRRKLELRRCARHRAPRQEAPAKPVGYDITTPTRRAVVLDPGPRIHASCRWGRDDAFAGKVHVSRGALRGIWARGIMAGAAVGTSRSALRGNAIG